jgi:sugar-specific transcriptional regulator TrmB/DNA-binding CsgD family transcriptional regulator
MVLHMDEQSQVVLSADPGRNGVLGALGLGGQEESLYLALLARPYATLAELVESTGSSAHQLRRRLRTLVAVGLVAQDSARPTRFVPTSPDIAVEVLALRREEEIQRARLAAAKLTPAFRDAMARHGSGMPVQGLRGREAVVQAYFQLVRSARQEVMLVDKPPYAVAEQSHERANDLFEHELLKKGIRCRVLYDPAAFELPGRVQHVRRLVAAGQEARVLAGAPKMAIADRRSALIPIDAFPFESGWLLSPACSLLPALTMLFDMAWERAAPLWPPGAQGGADDAAPPPWLSREDEHLLALLAAGLADKVIALRLGVGQRTVERRTARLMSLLGAQSRFQAGIQACERGLLGARARRPADRPARPGRVRS